MRKFKFELKALTPFFKEVIKKTSRVSYGGRSSSKANLVASEKAFIDGNKST